MEELRQRGFLLVGLKAVATPISLMSRCVRRSLWFSVPKEKVCASSREQPAITFRASTYRAK